MNAGEVNGWWVVAAAVVPITIDLASEPWRIPVFLFFAVWFGFFSFLLYTAAKNNFWEGK